jgi:ferredoxin, 2Fe-2S
MDGITVLFVTAAGVEHTVKNAPIGHSLMEVARANGVQGIPGDCGGACSCATCHVYIDALWRDRVGPPDDVESMTLDTVTDLRPESRLSCQIKVRPELDGLKVVVANE